MMFAFILDELRDWREYRMTRRTLTSSLALTLVAALSLLQPLVLALSATLVFLGFGWSEGNRYQPAMSARRLLISFPATPAAVAAGKALASLTMWLFMLLAFSPPLALAAIAWGVSAGAAAACVLSWLVGFFAAICIGFASSLLFGRSEGLPGFVISVIWLVVSLFIKTLAPFNPFVQVWAILKNEGGSSPLLGMGAMMLAASALLAISAFVLARMRRGKHE
jgi:hypothetical protein